MSKIKRDEGGKFAKGVSANPKNQFSSSNQPKNSGRKPSRFKQILEGLSAIGETLSLEDYKNLTATILTLTPIEMKTLANNPKTPIAVVMICKAIGGDISNGRMDNLDKLLDRLFGKSTNNVDVTSKGDKVAQSIQIEILDGKDKDK